jgi:hypothetical protein
VPPVINLLKYMTVNTSPLTYIYLDVFAKTQGIK